MYQLTLQQEYQGITTFEREYIACTTKTLLTYNDDLQALAINKIATNPNTDVWITIKEDYKTILIYHAYADKDGTPIINAIK